MASTTGSDAPPAETLIAGAETDARLSDRTVVAPTVAGGSHVRWWVGVGVGWAASLPLVWLLSFAATLPFLIGLFFFVLFGLLIGAVTHRVAAAGRPYRRGALLLGTTALVLLAWGLSLIKESRDFPYDMGKDATVPRQRIGNRTAAEYRALVADQTRTFLKKQYPPGGTLGYVRWMLAGGKIKKGALPAVSRTLRRGQAGLWFAVRVVLSVAFLGFGVSSQTLSLKLAIEPSVRSTAGAGGRDKV